MFDDTCPPAPRPPDDGGHLAATVETYPDAPDECTLFPADADPETLLTTWLSAEEGSFVDCAEMR
ncbi:MAG: hypothetical protein ABEJ82_03750 [Haloplanus sp.]